MKALCITLILIFTFCFPGCNDKKLQNDEAGIQIVRNGIERVNKKIEYVEKKNAGNDENVLIGYPRRIETDTTGNIYVLDVKSDSVHKLDPDLNYITGIGQKGEGPGEFNYAIHIAVDKKNRLYVIDLNRRINIFNDRAEHEQMIRTDFPIKNIYIDKRSDTITIGYHKYFRSQHWKHYFLGDFSLNGMNHNDFFSKKQIFSNKYQKDDVALVAPMFVLYTGYLDNIYVCSGDKYEILVYGKDRRLKKKIMKEYAPIPVSKEALKLANDWLSQFPAVKKEYGNILKNQPVMRSITIDEKEQIWIELYQVQRIWKNSFKTRFDLFSQKGEYLYTTEIMEKMLTPPLFKNGHVYFGVETREGDCLIKKIKIINII